MSGKVLISGGGIAGCCLAWWLHEYGLEVTLVEQASVPRHGGYVIDFWGLGYDVAERMGLLPELQRHDLRVKEFRIVDREGRRTSGIDQGVMQDLTGGRLMSLPRSAVALALYEAIKDKVNIRFGDGVANLRQHAEGVEVEFENTNSDRFDLVFGADGLHSAVRRLAFGAEAQFEHFLGYYAAAFTACGYSHRDPHAYVACGAPGRQIWRITLDADRTVFLLLFASPEPLPVAAHDMEAQKAVLLDRFAGIGWESEETGKALKDATDLYFDRVSQIVMPRWTEGRIALLGDACGCPSLLAGEGSSMAMAEAYTLAGELNRAGGDHLQAFRAYEQQLHPYVLRKQKGAIGFAASFVPRTGLGLWARDATLNLVGYLHLTGLLFRAQVRDVVKLGSYGR